MMHRCSAGGRAGAGGSARRRNLRAWAQLLAVACLAFPGHFVRAEGEPAVKVTIVDRESLMLGGSQNGAAPNETTEAAKPARTGPPQLFSPEWEKMYSSARIGCHLGRKRYVWRPCGFGSNIVHLLNAFVYGLAVKKWVDVAVISPPGQLDSLHCTRDDGVALSGFDCLFRPMPHVCTFSSIDEWKQYMTKKTVRKMVQEESNQLTWQYIRLHQGHAQTNALKPFGVDSYGALAVMARYMWGNIEPALQEHVRREVESPDLDVFRQSPYVGLHIRRGDKITEGEMQMVETKEYLEAARKYLEDGADPANPATGLARVDEIRSIFVASDDDNAVEEVRSLVPDFFPNVEPDNIAWISGGGKDDVQTRSKLESYNGFIFILADLQLLANADVFVGTYTSNVSRLVALLREGIHGKPRDSCISLDKERFGVNYRKLRTTSRSDPNINNNSTDPSWQIDPWFV